MFTPGRAPGEGREKITLKSISPSLLGVHRSIMEVKKQNAVTHLAEELCVFLHSSYQRRQAQYAFLLKHVLSAPLGICRKKKGEKKILLSEIIKIKTDLTSSCSL